MLAAAAGLFAVGQGAMGRLAELQRGVDDERQPVGKSALVPPPPTCLRRRRKGVLEAAAAAVADSSATVTEEVFERR
jgi:hypothetical protein